MKGIDLFCSSSASTAICSSMDQRSVVRNRHLVGNRKPFDHQHHRRGDSHGRSSAESGSRRSRRRGSTRILTTTTNTTTTSHPVSTNNNPKYHHHHSTSGTTVTSRKTYTKPTISHGHENSLLDSSRYLLSDTTFLDDHQYSAEMDMPVSATAPQRQRPSTRSAHALVHYLNEPQSSPPPLSRSRALVPLEEPISSVRSTPVYNEEQPRLSSSSSRNHALVPRHHEEQPRLSSSSSTNRALVPRHELLPSPSRSRGLVRHEQSSSSLKSRALVPHDHNDQLSVKTRSVNRFSADSSPALLPAPHQVVVLRVSLHCKGCEAKVRKHVSRMEGVTSYNIDFANKKVTVTGDVTPLGVLTSVSKVKNAEFWPSSSATSSPTSN